MASTTAYKILAYSLQVLCTLLALVLISFGVYIMSYETNEIGNIVSVFYIGFGTAAIIMLLWGYLSAWRENVCCTVSFITILYVVIIVQLAGLCLLAQKESTAASNLANSLEATWEEELNSPGAMSLYENWFQCCGRGSPQDYIVNERLPPATCFRDHDRSKADNLIHTGCRVEFENYWQNLLGIFNIIGWVLVAVELILSFVSCGLCNSIRNDRRRTYY
ncbi:protein late bloomer [Drosophila grimshawi]|uniref:GH21500 n=1 Tax=Drosophila grimshawi TaxID=7222 RepID=B4J3W9_DROGR|nr:protein late bloomer [Drosophila grimshawi]EDW01552.1 GH21500 [Drosophila grimshawi]